jgi:hypothetical protein
LAENPGDLGVETVARRRFVVRINLELFGAGLDAGAEGIDEGGVSELGR